MYRPRNTYQREASASSMPAAAVAGAGPAHLVPIPDTAEVRQALDAARWRARFRATFRSTLFILVVVAAVAVLTAVLLLPILRIYGSSMAGTLDAGNVVISVKPAELHQGDVVAFYYNNNILVKRVVARSGEWVDVDSDGTVYVNGNRLDEPYLSSKAYGQDTNVTFPYQVPEGQVFVMGDNREVSVDSRSTAIGCVSSEQVVGRIVFRLWPLPQIGPVS